MALLLNVLLCKLRCLLGFVKRTRELQWSILSPAHPILLASLVQQRPPSGAPWPPFPPLNLWLSMNALAKALATYLEPFFAPLSVSPPQYLICQRIRIILWSKQLLCLSFLHASLRWSLPMPLYFSLFSYIWVLFTWFNKSRIEQRVSFSFWVSHQVPFQWLTCKIWCW